MNVKGCGTHLASVKDLPTPADPVMKTFFPFLTSSRISCCSSERVHSSEPSCVGESRSEVLSYSASFEAPSRCCSSSRRRRASRSSFDLLCFRKSRSADADEVFYLVDQHTRSRAANRFASISFGVHLGLGVVVVDESFLFGVIVALVDSEGGGRVESD